MVQGGSGVVLVITLAVLGILGGCVVAAVGSMVALNGFVVVLRLF